VGTSPDQARLWRSTWVVPKVQCLRHDTVPCGAESPCRLESENLPRNSRSLPPHRVLWAWRSLCLYAASLIFGGSANNERVRHSLRVGPSKSSRNRHRRLHVSVAN
jgi:hypothetical protein